MQVVCLPVPTLMGQDDPRSSIPRQRVVHDDDAILPFVAGVSPGIGGPSAAGARTNRVDVEVARTSSTRNCQLVLAEVGVVTIYKSALGLQLCFAVGSHGIPEVIFMAIRGCNTITSRLEVVNCMWNGRTCQREGEASSIEVAVEDVNLRCDGIVAGVALTCGAVDHVEVH